MQNNWVSKPENKKDKDIVSPKNFKEWQMEVAKQLYKTSEHIWPKNYTRWTENLL